VSELEKWLLLGGTAGALYFILTVQPAKKKKPDKKS
jgi:hypothetical protein